ncbi:hypothetical protein BSNK01_01330 [Bacillaceae bacterium]
MEKDSRGFSHHVLSTAPETLAGRLKEENDKFLYAYDFGEGFFAGKDSLDYGKESVQQADANNDVRVAVASEATLEQWNALYDLAIRCKKLKSWGMDDDVDLFVVEDAESGLRGYCSVLGQKGELFSAEKISGLYFEAISRAIYPGH